MRPFVSAATIDREVRAMKRLSRRRVCALVLAGAAVVVAGLSGAAGAASTRAVSSDVGPVIEFWDGATWTEQASANPEGSASLTAVAALSATDVWAVGSYGVGGQDGKALAEHWDGSSWQQVPIPTPQGANEVHLNGLSAVSPTNIWAVGSWAGVFTGPVEGYPYFLLIEHWDGNSWTIVRSPSPGVSKQLSGVVALSADDAWAVGYYQFESHQTILSRTLALHWNGTAWRRVASPHPGPRQYQGSTLSAVAAMSRKSVWAVGTYVARVQGRHFANRALTVHWNGKTWKQVSSSTPRASGGLAAVAVVGPDDVWAVGSYHNGHGGRVLTERWNGHSWRTVPAHTGEEDASYQTLTSLAVLAPDDIWAVGSYGAYDTGDQTLSEHWNGQAWSVVPSPNPDPPLGGSFSAVAATSPTSVWVVGDFYPEG